MRRLNLGCGPDIKQYWTNVDKIHRDDIEYWDAIDNLVPKKWLGYFDFILINHVLCTMKPADVSVVLKKANLMLKLGGKLQVIDVDLLKAIGSYLRRDKDSIPINEGNLDYKLCMHLSGYGTRLSLFTPDHLVWTLLHEGEFSGAKVLDSSEHDLRPKESLIVEATK